MLLKSYLGSISRVAELDGYAATIDGLPGGAPVGHWRLGEVGGSQMIDRKGGRHGTYSGEPVFGTPGLPQSSDDAVDFAGVASAAVPDDSGLHLAMWSLSLWCKFAALPIQRVVVFSKDQSGLVLGDTAITVDESGELVFQIQTAAAEHRIVNAILANTSNHLVMRADNTGFDAYLNGRYLGKNTGVTDAWQSNTQPLRLGAAPWTSALADVIIDEVALYDRVLTEAEVITLSQRTEAPVAASESAVVPESATTAIPVTANDIFIGQKANLSVEVVSQPSGGDSVTVDGNKDIVYTAGAVDADTARSFTYRITDLNGTSNVATTNVTVQNTASAGGGTLVYDWQPLASWIDGVAFADRRGEDINANVNNWAVTGATVGGSLVKSISGDTGLTGQYCWNRAPTGHPALEMYVAPNSNGGQTIIGKYIRLWEQFVGTPRHVRVVFELKTCKPSDPTTFKSAGVPGVSGTYVDWNLTRSGGGIATKYFIGCIAGNITGPHGGGRANWWNGTSVAEFDLRVDRMGARIQPGSGGDLATYIYVYGRPGRFGQFQNGNPNFGIDDPGILGVWHRIEIEMRLSTAASCPANAIYQNPGINPTQTGDGFVRHYCTKDIDGELGAPGARTLVNELTGLLYFCRQDNIHGDNNMHINANILAPWINYYYGGSVGSVGEGWSWIRRIQVYQHD